MNEVARITQEMKTVCVGRFLIEMPEGAQVELRQARIDGYDISVFDETQEHFQKRLADRARQLSATPDRLGGNKNPESAQEVETDNGLAGKISRTAGRWSREPGETVCASNMFAMKVSRQRPSYHSVRRVAELSACRAHAHPFGGTGT